MNFLREASRQQTEEETAMPGKPLLTKEIGDYGNRKTYASNYVKGDLTSAGVHGR